VRRTLCLKPCSRNRTTEKGESKYFTILALSFLSAS
jgi:hypothetical protein